MMESPTYRVLSLLKLPPRIERTKLFQSLVECQKLCVPGYPPTYTAKQFVRDQRVASKPLGWQCDECRPWRSMSMGMVLVDDVVVAVCEYVQTREDPMFNVCTIEGVGVHPQYRKLGLCKFLLEHSVAHLATSGYRRARIHAYVDNLAACRCYESVFGRCVNEDDECKAFELILKRRR